MRFYNFLASCFYEDFHDDVMNWVLQIFKYPTLLYVWWSDSQLYLFGLFQHQLKPPVLRGLCPPGNCLCKNLFIVPFVQKNKISLWSKVWWTEESEGLQAASIYKAFFLKINSIKFNNYFKLKLGDIFCLKYTKYDKYFGFKNVWPDLGLADYDSRLDLRLKHYKLKLDMIRGTKYLVTTVVQTKS